MTEQELRNKVVEIAKKYFGIKEGGKEHKEILAAYNNHKPLARNYKVQVTDAWCATFVSAVGILSDLADIMPTECSCGHMITLYDKLGRWDESDNYVPKVGDIIMYDWADTGSGDCTGWADHVGIVAAVNGSNLTIIEGNYKNSVGYRSLNVNGRYIRGYCLPDYASKATKAVPGVVTTPTKTESPIASNAKVDPAACFSKDVAGTYKVTAALLNVRSGAGTSKAILTTIMTGTKVQNYGYYTVHNGVKWLFIQFTQNGKTITGFASSKYLKK